MTIAAQTNTDTQQEQQQQAQQEYQYEYETQNPISNTKYQRPNIKYQISNTRNMHIAN